MVAEKGTWYVNKPRIRLENTNIPTVDPDGAFRYLGAKMEPWKGIYRSIIAPEILSVVGRVRKLPLKPRQKIEPFTKYNYPRYIYHLLINPPSDNVL